MAEEEPFVSFWTESTWTTDDVVTLAQSVGTIYSALLAARVRDRLFEQQFRQSREYWRETLRYWEQHLDHPFLHEFFHLWERAMRKGCPPPFFWMPTPSPWMSAEVASLSGMEVFRSLGLYTPETGRCRLHRAKLASPGGFSFTGSGEIIRECRELFKDLAYRIGRRERGKLEITEQYVRLRREYRDENTGAPPLPPVGSERELARIVDEAHANIERMERDGKLLPVVQNLERLPE